MNAPWRVVLEYAPITLAVLLLTIGLNVYLLEIVPKGFVPEEDTGRISGTIIGDQDSSFQAMKQRHRPLRRHHQSRSGRRRGDGL